MNKRAIWLVVGVAISMALYLYWVKPMQIDQECKDLALKASIEEIDPSVEPNASIRQSKQEAYRYQYHINCLQQHGIK